MIVGGHAHACGEYLSADSIQEKLHQCWRYEPIDGPLFQETAHFAESHQLPLFIHLYSYQDAVGLIAYRKTHPRLKAVIALWPVRIGTDAPAYPGITTLCRGARGHSGAKCCRFVAARCVEEKIFRFFLDKRLKPS